MNNLLKTLVFDSVALTVVDTTQMVNEGIKRHRLAPTSACIFGKALSAMTYMSSCLKEEKGEISLSLKNDGESGEIAVSGNKKLYLRGYIDNTNLNGGTDENAERAALGENGSLTVIRDDGYSRPFVGSCALFQKGIDEGFEEYFRVSEQIPTRIRTSVILDEKGECIFAGVIALQPLPFTKEEILRKTWELPLEMLLGQLKDKGLERCVEDNFTVDKEVWERREAVYKCNCSREYLAEILVSLGKEQFEEIVKEEGAVKIHCHYCNTDYQFTSEDGEKLFSR